MLRILLLISVAERVAKSRNFVFSFIISAIIAYFLLFFYHFEARIQFFKTRIIWKNHIVHVLREREMRNRVVLMFLVILFNR